MASNSRNWNKRKSAAFRPPRNRSKGVLARNAGCPTDIASARIHASIRCKLLRPMRRRADLRESHPNHPSQSPITTHPSPLAAYFPPCFPRRRQSSKGDRQTLLMRTPETRYLDATVRDNVGVQLSEGSLHPLKIAAPISVIRGGVLGGESAGNGSFTPWTIQFMTCVPS